MAARANSAEAAIDVAIPCRAWKRAQADAADIATAAARMALAGAHVSALVELSIVLGDDALVQGLNSRWRGHDRATNVLSFATGDEGAPDRPRLLGDVVLAYGTVAREARDQGKTLAAHLSHLVAHGVLHLVGYDHADDDEARRMESLERRVLKRLGVADPYRAEAANG